MQRWNFLGRLVIALPLLIAGSAGAAVIYKWTDADGVVHYSDQAVPGAEKIVTSGAALNGMNASGSNRPTPSAFPKPLDTGLDYSVFALESPANEQVFFGDEIVPARLHLEPGLKPNQTVTWQLNGKSLDDQAPNAVSISLQGLPRGTYSVMATVTDPISGQSKSSGSVTFYVRQPSELSPQHKKS